MLIMKCKIGSLLKNCKSILNWKMLVAMFAALLVAFPFLWMFFASFKAEDEVFTKSFKLFPAVWHFENYVIAWESAPFAYFFRNSLIAASIVVISQTFTCALAAYAFAKINFKFKNIIFVVFLIAMMIPEEATIIPNYMLAQKLGLINTNFGIAMLSLTSVFGVFLLRQSIAKIPDELLQAAELDGCNELKKFFYIVLPNIKSSLATVAILAFLHSWNSYMWPYIITDQTLARTVQIGIRYLILPDLGPQWPKLMAMACIIILPVLVLFVFLQKYFVEGMTNSGMK